MTEAGSLGHLWSRLRPPSDDSLVRRAAEGDERAFEAIYNRFHQDLYRFCLAMVGNSQDAQDALQNTMLKVLRALPGEEREIQLKPWLYRIARNESVESLRRRRDNVELEPQQALVASPADTAEMRERLRTLLADLEQLPERQRATLVMRELAGLDFAQIGAVFGTSPAVARQTLYEARLSLQQLEAGREMRCADVMRELSDADGRVTRRREIRAHLHSCADCRAFRDEIDKRREDLAALAPLPLAASAGVLHGVLGAKTSAGGSAGGLSATVGAGAGKTIATSAIVKSVATVAVATVVGLSAADRSGLVDLPVLGKAGSDGAPSVKPGGTAGEADVVEEVGAAESGDASAQQRLPGEQATTAGRQDKESRPIEDDQGSHVDGDTARSGDPSGSQADASPPGNSSSNSQAGLSPPGGGYGSSSSQRQGRPEQLPEAASHGQETSAAKKPGHAGPPADQDSQPGQAGAKGHAGPPNDRGPNGQPAPPAEEQAPGEPPGAPPPVEAPPKAKGGPGKSAPALPPGLGR